MRRLVAAALAATATCFGVIGCGKQSPRTAAKQTAASRSAAICGQAFHELLAIDLHKLKPDVAVIGRLIEEAAEESEKIDEATDRDLRRLPASTHTGGALADLARATAELQAIVRVVRHHGGAYGQFPRDLVLRVLKANGGCGRVQLRKPTIAEG